MTQLDLLIIGLLIAGATSGIMLWEIGRSIIWWLNRPSKSEKKDETF